MSEAAPAESEGLSASELRSVWPALSADERRDGFLSLDRSEADEFFEELSTEDQVTILEQLPLGQQRLWLRLLAPDDAVDVIQHIGEERRDELLQMLDDTTRREVTALLAYGEDAAGGLMSPRFARLRPGMNVGEAIRYLQRQAQEELETIYYAYVLDREQRLCGVVSFRELFRARPDAPLADIMRSNVVAVPDTLDQEEVARVIAQHDLNALPVVDEAGRMKGIVTIDDIVDVVEEEATEDMQRLGGLEALHAPYLQTDTLTMVKKRAGWLSALFLGEMLTASAMGHFEDEIAKAVVLALFVPLIISSGGNSGSQATTLIIRAIALGEASMRDFWRVVRRELVAGLSLGLILAVIGFIRVVAWQAMFQSYGEHYMRVGLTVSVSLIGVVTWGTLAGSTLPFIISKLGFDPASASAPFVATLVDVSGLVIYFSVAQILLGGALL